MLCRPGWPPTLLSPPASACPSAETKGLGCSVWPWFCSVKHRLDCRVGSSHILAVQAHPVTLHFDAQTVSVWLAASPLSWLLSLPKAIFIWKEFQTRRKLLD